MPRQSTLAASGHQAEARHLLVDQVWSSATVSQYLQLRYGLDIPAATLRRYRISELRKMEAVGELPEKWRDHVEEHDKSPQAIVRKLTRVNDDLPDVMARRLALIRLQEKRVSIDTEHEIGMAKLFASQQKEISLLNQLYNDVKADLQELGLWPKLEASPQMAVNVTTAVMQQTAQVQSGGKVKSPISEIVGESSQADIRDAGRKILQLRRREGNGQAEDESS